MRYVLLVCVVVMGCSRQPDLTPQQKAALQEIEEFVRITRLHDIKWICLETWMRWDADPKIKSRTEVFDALTAFCDELDRRAKEDQAESIEWGERMMKDVTPDGIVAACAKEKWQLAPKAAKQ
jgi:hypothetical protein